MEGEFDIDLSEFPQSYNDAAASHQFNPSQSSIWAAAFYDNSYGFQEQNPQFKNINPNNHYRYLQSHHNFSTQTSGMGSDSYTSWRRRINPFSQTLSLPFGHANPVSHASLFGHEATTATTSSSSSGNYKTRIRWSEDLHDRFVDCVNQLGGPDKATPKAILKLMQPQLDSLRDQPLTILHIKSHLQKYRNVKYIPESVEEEGIGISNKTCIAQMDTQTGMQLKEALQLQVDVQKRLHEQLEIQNKLQLRIEEQGKKLKMMIEEQHKNLTNSSNHT